MAEISKDAQRVLQGASPEALQYVTSNAGGSRVTSGEASALLAKFNANPQNVLASGNVQQTLASPTPRPDDLLGIRSQIMNEAGVNTRQSELDAAQKAYEAAYGQLGQFDTATEALNRKLGEQTLSTNVLRGEQATASNLRATERSGVARAAELAATTVEGKRAAVQAAKQEAEAQFGIRQQEVQDKKNLILQYPGAGITFGDSFETASGKIAKYANQQKDDARKQTLQDKLIELGQKSSGSLKDLEKRLKKVNKKAYEQSLKEIEQKNQLFDLQVQDTKSQISNRGSSGGLTEYQQMQMLKQQEEDQVKRDREYQKELAGAVEESRYSSDPAQSKAVSIAKLQAQFPEYSVEDNINALVPDIQKQPLSLSGSAIGGIKDWWNSWTF